MFVLGVRAIIILLRVKYPKAFRAVKNCFKPEPRELPVAYQGLARREGAELAKNGRWKEWDDVHRVWGLTKRFHFKGFLAAARV